MDFEYGNEIVSTSELLKSDRIWIPHPWLFPSFPLRLLSFRLSWFLSKKSVSLWLFFGSFCEMADNQSQSSESSEPYLNYCRLQDDIEKVLFRCLIFDWIASWDRDIHIHCITWKIYSSRYKFGKDLAV